MSDVIQSPTAPPPAAPAVDTSTPSVPVSRGESEQRMPRVGFKDKMAAKFDAVGSDDAGLRSITKDRADQKPQKLRYNKVAAKDGSLSVKEASKWYEDYHRKTGVTSDPVKPSQQWTATDDLKIFKPIGDSSPLETMRREQDDDDAFARETGFKNVKDATDAVRRGRVIQQKAFELEREQQQAEEAAIQARVRAESGPQQRQPEPVRQAEQQPVQPPQQGDAEVQQQRALAARYAEYQKLSATEKLAVQQLEQWHAWANKQPEIQPENWQRLWDRACRGDSKAQKRVTFLQQQRQARDKVEHIYNVANEGRVTREVQLAGHEQAVQGQQQQALIKQHNDRFDAWLETNHPEDKKGTANYQQVREGAKEYLREVVGMSDAQIAADPSLREYGAQITIYYASKQHRALKQRRNVQRAPNYQASVQKPGVGGIVSGRGYDEQEVKRLQHEIANSSERKAIIAAAKLQKLRRAMKDA
jgi:hypothetical protein